MGSYHEYEEENDRQYREDTLRRLERIDEELMGTKDPAEYVELLKHKKQTLETLLFNVLYDSREEEKTWNKQMKMVEGELSLIEKRYSRIGSNKGEERD